MIRVSVRVRLGHGHGRRVRVRVRVFTSGGCRGVQGVPAVAFRFMVFTSCSKGQRGYDTGLTVIRHRAAMLQHRARGSTLLGQGAAMLPVAAW